VEGREVGPRAEQAGAAAGVAQVVQDVPEVRAAARGLTYTPFTLLHRFSKTGVVTTAQ